MKVLVRKGHFSNGLDRYSAGFVPVARGFVVQYPNPPAELFFDRVRSTG